MEQGGLILYGNNLPMWELRGGGVWVQLLEDVLLVLGECICNAPVFSYFLPAFDDTGSQGFPPRRVVYPRGF